MEHTCLTSCGLIDLFSYQCYVSVSCVKEGNLHNGIHRRASAEKFISDSLTLVQREGFHDTVETGGSKSPDQLT